MAFVSTGITITFHSGFFAELLDATPPAMSREVIDNSHHATPVWKRFLPSDLVDAGELKAVIAFFPKTRPPIDKAAESITMSFPDSAETDWMFYGFMTNYAPKGEFEGRATAEVTIKVDGEIVAGGWSSGA